MKWSWRLFTFFAVITLLFLSFGIFVSRTNLNIISEFSTQKHPLFHDYKGVTHTVSTHSQGSGDTKTIIASAAKAKLAYLFITDLNHFQPTSEITGYQQGVLMLPGKKVSFVDSHLLLYAQESLSQVDSLGASNAMANDLLNKQKKTDTAPLLALAHPFKKGFHWNEQHSNGLDGLEVINMRHMWQQAWLNKKASFLWSLFLYIFNPEVALLRLINEPLNELRFWDKLDSNHATIGLLGNQSTAKIFNLGFMSSRFPTYQQSFEFASNHILLRSELTGVVERDRKKIFSALKKGQFYMAIDALAPPKGFAAYVKKGRRIYPIGSHLKFQKGLKLFVDLPQVSTVPLEVKVYRNGQEIALSKKINSHWKITQPGRYRIYARLRLQFPIPGELRWVPWIYTNHIYIE